MKWRNQTWKKTGRKWSLTKPKVEKSIESVSSGFFRQFLKTKFHIDEHAFCAECDTQRSRSSSAQQRRATGLKELKSVRRTRKNAECLAKMVSWDREDTKWMTSKAVLIRSSYLMVKDHMDICSYCPMCLLSHTYKIFSSVRSYIILFWS